MPQNVETVGRLYRRVRPKSYLDRSLDLLLAAKGMEPRSRWMLDFAVWGLTKRRVQALRWYNALLLPIGLLTQRRLEWGTGLIDVAGVGEVLLACRRP